MDIDVLADDIRVDVPVPLEETIERAVRFAAVEFFRDTEAWTQVVLTNPVIGQSRQVLDLRGAEASIHAIKDAVWHDPAGDSYELERVPEDSVRFHSGSEPRCIAASRNPELTVLLDGDAPTDAVLQTRVILVPSRTAGSLPDAIAEPYFEGIRAGAVSRLLSMPDKEWTHYATSQRYALVFEEAKVRCRRQFQGRRERPRRRVRYGGI